MERFQVNRDETLTLIARQIAISEGRVWNSITHNTRAELLTLAGNILATVERRMRAWDWGLR